jgi:hypothetical protein
MLRQAKHLNSFKLGARDGEIGKVREFYFDDKSWAIRYLIANTGDWLGGRCVLISPYALQSPRDADMVIPVDLTKDQIERSPALDAGARVSRLYELQYYPHFNWPVYWGEPDRQAGFSGLPHPADNADPSLQGTADVTGYKIEASDGEIGQLDDFVIDDETWIIRYLIVDTNVVDANVDTGIGRKSLISTRWIDRVDWENATIFTHVTQQTILHAPEFTDQALITRNQEQALHRHHNRPGYWEAELRIA